MLPDDGCWHEVPVYPETMLSPNKNEPARYKFHEDMYYNRWRNFMHFEESYFRREVRCGYEVSEKVKKIWAVELNLLEYFDNII